MSTLKTINVIHPSGTTNNIVNDASGNVAVGGTLTSSTITSATATALTIQSAGTTAMTIDTSQNVGIGTTSPGKKLDVANGGADPVVSRFTGGSASALLAVTNNGGANNSYLEIGLDSSGSSVGYGSGGQFVSAGINGTGTAYDLILHQYNAKNIVFATSNTERMRLESSGNVAIGSTSANSYRLFITGTGSDTVNVVNPTMPSGNYFIRFAIGSGTGSNVGYIGYNGSGVTYSTTSDYRLKHSVTPLITGLTTVSALKPVTYKWNADNSDGEGFIAHELQSVIPFAVTGDKDAVDEEGNIKPQGVDYSKIVVHLVAAIQELEARLAALEAK